MKKIASVILISACLLNGCHSGTTPASNSTNSSGNNGGKDTSKAHAVIQQPADTTIKDGAVIKKYANGVVKERSFYISGRRNGECQSFFPNGKLQSDDFFIDGMINGATTVYFDNGQKQYEGQCTKGNPSGVWKFYDNTGKLIRSKDYDTISANPVM